MEVPRRHRRRRNYCCVVGCHSNEESRTIKFFTFPWKKLPVRTELWRKAIKRENADGSEWFPHSRASICAKHFVSGQPSRTRADPDYVPSIFPTNHAKAKTPADTERAQRVSYYSSLSNKSGQPTSFRAHCGVKAAQFQQRFRPLF
jgi:hypothetical protein